MKQSDLITPQSPESWAKQAGYSPMRCPEDFSHLPFTSGHLFDQDIHGTPVGLCKYCGIPFDFGPDSWQTRMMEELGKYYQNKNTTAPAPVPAPSLPVHLL